MILSEHLDRFGIPLVENSNSMEDLIEKGFLFKKNLDGKVLFIEVHKDGKHIASFDVAPSEAQPEILVPLMVSVDKAYQRQGIATDQLAEKFFGKKIKKGNQSKQGKAFRKAYDKKFHENQ